jgi:phosphatidylcholine synthase
LLPVAAAWLVHLYTASGTVLALLAAQSVFESDYRSAFLYLALQVVVDATDGVLARWARVSQLTPHFRGAHLDDTVDYVSYVFVPALLVWHARLVPAEASLGVCAAMLLSSAYGFSRADAKTDDHFFTGFPSYWNIVVLYLLMGAAPAMVNAVVLVVLAGLVFVPIRYVYPSRTPILRRLTNGLGVAWAVLMLVMIWRLPLVSRSLIWVSAVFPVYYVGLSLLLSARRSAAAERGI